MIPPRKEYELVAVDQWLPGEIVDINYDQEHDFTWKGVVSTGPAARIIFTLDGYKDKKSSGWVKFIYADKSKLFKTWVLPLVEGARKNMKFDLDYLKGMRIKVMYAQNGEYQNIAMVRPLESKLLRPPEKTITKEDISEPLPF